MTVKQAVGIDVAKKELVVSIGRMSHDTGVDIYAHKTFSNHARGFMDLVAWVDRMTMRGVQTRYVMEATGVYHECVAYYLSGHGHQLSIVLPNKISNYFRTLDVKTITDKTASQAICQFGLERKLDDWQRPKKVFRELRQLTRERDQLITDRTVLKNQLHAEMAEAFPNQGSIRRAAERIQLINGQELEIRAELAGIIKRDAELARKIGLITTIPGVGRLTAVTVLAETNGFELISNKKQLVGYSGLDVRLKDSGTSVKGKPRISKRGNRHLRKAMHMPALAAIRHNREHKMLFVRLVSGHGIKMKSVVAVQRKILELIYTIFKTDKPFDRDYVRIEVPEALNG
ncbi:IS110 family transposase [Pedobacter frigiditerrae]|uniref:IS110 family transposase n=1 Tax=Pedobacter frigiditerrae TaxID=2530452 RepID=A0A4R0MNV0_9SPHI|nr:IS110 family transposase [Pedobacter frigiditerrae]TCC87902.1 IS110 family transposase [Pedobacter frigiditerrae]